MKYKLIITDRAKKDRDREFHWFSENYSKEFAARWYVGVSDAVRSIGRDPSIGHKADENDRFAFELYQFLYGTRKNKHRILYAIESDTVSILHIRHSAQSELTGDELLDV
jgi:plasmid stabilization system protein ParE